MARRRRREDTAVALFPFLSVLACVIGTLTLLLSALAVGHMGGSSAEEIWLSERLQTAEIFLAGGRARLEELEAQLADHSERARREQELGRRLEGLGLEPELSLEELEERVSLEMQAKEFEERRGQLRQEHLALIERVRRKSVELEDRETRRAGAPIIIDPSGVGRDQVPYLVLCAADYVELFFLSGDTYGRFPVDQLEYEPDFKRFLKRVGVISDALVIFMIRPDGMKTYSTASRIADKLSVRNAKLPLPGTGELDFSLLRGAKP